MKTQPTLFLCTLLLAFTLAACDTATPVTTPEAPSAEEISSLFPMHAAKGQEKLPVCHLDDEGILHRIEVAEPAYDTHIAHGDGAVEGAVPGMADYLFNDACEPVPASCPCFTAADLDGFTFSTPLYRDIFLETEP
jgi:hypothetical protein